MIFLVLVKSYLMWPVCLLPSSFMVSIDHLQMYLKTLSLEKEINVLEKCLEKVVNFGSKNLFELWEYFIEKENASADHSRFV